jgi:uncharacterized protein YcnI
MSRIADRHLVVRLLAVSLGAGFIAVATAGAASAHVTVHADAVIRQATDVAVTFRVPNELDSASTTKLQVFFPASTPLLGVLVQRHTGWTTRTTTAKLAKPVMTDDGSITEAVSEVDWTADTPADALQPGESGDFVVTAGQLPDAASVTFKALQTYSNGQVVRWIELATAGADPEHPAPTLDLVAPTGAAPENAAAAAMSSSGAMSASGAMSSSGAMASSSGANASTQAAIATSLRTRPIAATTSSRSATDVAARTLGVSGLVVGLVGIGFALLAIRRRPTGVSDPQ